LQWQSQEELTVLSDCLLLVNPISGGGKAFARTDGIADQLMLGGYQVRTVVSSSQANLVENIKNAPEELVVLLSGDGSLRAAAEIIVKDRLLKRLAPLPAGRGNDFCAALGIAKDLNSAVKKLATNPELANIDVMQVNQDRIALGAVSIGLDAAAAEISHNIQLAGNRWLTGAPLYVYSALKALKNWRTLDIELNHSDGSKDNKGIWLYVVSNSGQFGGGMKISPNSNLSDGLLEVISVGEVSKFDFLKTLPKVFSGTHLSHPKVQTTTLTEIKIHTKLPVLAFADGEPISITPIEVRVLPQALTVVK